MRSLLIVLLMMTAAPAWASCEEEFAYLDLPADTIQAYQPTFDMCNRVITIGIDNVKAANVNSPGHIIIQPKTWQEPYFERLKSDLCRAAGDMKVFFDIPTATDFLVAADKRSTINTKPLDKLRHLQLEELNIILGVEETGAWKVGFLPRFCPRTPEN